MSIQAVGWVLDHSHAEGVDRLVLIALANHANADTGECNPGQRRIGREARVGQTTVRRALERLVAIGEVEVMARGRGHGTTRYLLPWIIRPALAATLAARSEPPEWRATGGADGAPEGPSEPPEWRASSGPSEPLGAPSEPRGPVVSLPGRRETSKPIEPTRARAREGVGPALPTRTAADIEREEAAWQRAAPEVAAAALASARAGLAPPPRTEPDTEPEGEP